MSVHALWNIFEVEDQINSSESYGCPNNTNMNLITGLFFWISVTFASPQSVNGNYKDYLPSLRYSNTHNFVRRKGQME